VQADHQHWPLILVRVTQLGDFIVHETSDREGIASDSPSGKCKRLPGVPNVVQAVPNARSPYFQASRHTILVKTKTIGAGPLASLVSNVPRPRCSAMCLDGS
jgi:hypothetical protein